MLILDRVTHFGNKRIQAQIQFGYNNALPKIYNRIGLPAGPQEETKTL